MNDVEAKKHAFKMGFALQLARHHINPSDLPKAAEKVAAVGTALSLGLGGALGSALIVPRVAGNIAGQVASSGMDDELETTGELRKIYLIKKYREMINEQKSKLENKALDEALYPA